MANSNPLILLSYVGGPALLTNATTLFVLSTSNRFARAVDRSRLIADRLLDPSTALPHYRSELPEVHQRVLLIGRALVCFYFAAASFAIATLGSISGAVLAEALQAAWVPLIIKVALGLGVIGFCAFITGAVLLVFESRTAVRSLSREYDDIVARYTRKEF